MKIKNAEILCVGTELLLGEVVNTNAAYISRELAYLGISVYHTAVVGDNAERLEEAIRESLSRADLLVMSGGLGPTYDDITKETVARVLGLPMVRDEAILEYIKEFFVSYGRPMPENNAKQADIPKGAIALHNRFGTAPGIFIEKDEKVVVLLPGPPFELRPMFEEHVAPLLGERRDKVLVSHNIHIMGMGESEVETYLIDLMKKNVNPSIAPYAKEGEMRLRVSALADNEKQGDRMCLEMIKKVMETPVGKYVYAFDAENIEKYVLGKLFERGLTIAVAESCTGGMLGQRLTDVGGASRNFLGGFITYSNEMKMNLLGVSEETLKKYSAVSEEVAIEMARGIREKTGCDIGVSITGEAGPVAATNNEVGTVFIGISAADGVYATKIKIPVHRNREYIRRVACSRALREVIFKLEDLK